MSRYVYRTEIGQILTSGSRRKVINGKMYDLDTAETIASWHNGLSQNDLYYAYECLKRKKTGEYFLYISTFDTDAIVPFCLSEAKRWYQETQSGDDYENLFGKVEE